MTDRARWAKRHLDYEFERQDLLELALTHRSASRRNNERLEFLGDAFINFRVGAMLYEHCPEYSEGELSRARAALVNGAALAAIARELELDTHVILGKGELRSGGSNRGSVLADCLEALVGAVLLDGGHEAAARLVAELYETRISNLPDPASLKDAKTKLQEWLQGHGRSLPNYNIETVTGKDHARMYAVSCTLEDGPETTSGSGRSRRRAEQAAAAAMLAKLTGE